VQSEEHTTGDSGLEHVSDAESSERRAHRGLEWFFIGGQGLRSGCSLIFFLILFKVFLLSFEVVAVVLYPALAKNQFSVRSGFASEFVLLSALFVSAALVALFERRKISEYYWSGPGWKANLAWGCIAGFLGLSLLVACLASGGWLHFGHVSLSGIAIAKYAAAWACVFLLVGCFEEGMFRSYLQFTLARGINFWWALAIVSFLCADLLLRSKGQFGLVAFVWMQPLSEIRGNGMWGVIAAGLTGLVPCFALYATKRKNASFWYASWVTSTLFGFIHVSNNGENWIGIFAAAAIGFVFCVSVWVTGSAWWAIGCHAGWDWGETYFYGTADSGMVAPGHLLSTTPFGNPFWSGGTDGPEGSILVLGAILVLLVALFVMYGTRSRLAGQIRNSTTSG
jgi:membrane protease YdiL (CAAX protease family)